MASIGHIAIGVAAGRAWAKRGAPRGTLLKLCLAFSALSMLPDADVVTFWLGVPYEHPFGHRGATHSFAFAALLSLLAFALARRKGWPPLTLAGYTFFIVASHAVLDSLTNGGLGVELWWPFSTERYFAPLTPIPVAPIGLHMLSVRGLLVVLVELVMFSPLFIYATFPRKAG